MLDELRRPTQLVDSTRCFLPSRNVGQSRWKGVLTFLMIQPPVACTLTADQQRCCADELLPGLASLATDCAWTENGMRFSFTPTSEHLASIVRVVDRERACCAFLTFQIVVPEGGGAFVLTLSGPEGTSEFLAGLGLHA